MIVSFGIDSLYVCDTTVCVDGSRETIEMTADGHELPNEKRGNVPAPGPLSLIQQPAMNGCAPHAVKSIPRRKNILLRTEKREYGNVMNITNEPV